VNSADNAIRIFKNGSAGNGVYVNNNVESSSKSGIVSVVPSNSGTTTGVMAVAGNDGSGLFPQTNDKVGVEGINLNTASGFGVIGRTRAPSGAGVVASYSGAGTGNALQVENGFIKVAGSTRTAFQHTTTAGNVVNNYTLLNYTNQQATDIVMVIPVYTSAYVNSPLGVWFFEGTWRIFRQDQAAMPANIIFNIIVIKQ
jgi:hypothetical protein